MNGPGRSVGCLGCLGLGFTLFGVLFGGIGGWFLVDALRLADSGEHAEGEVIKLVWTTSRGGRGGTTRAAHPVVRFQADGRTVEFQSRSGSSPPAHAVGDRVRVVYPPGRPDHAKIESFFDLYLPPLAFLGFGLLFGGIGLAVLLVPALARRRYRRAVERGTPVEATVTGIRPSAVRVNGRSAWLLVAQYQDPQTGRTHVFTSHRLWDNPEGRFRVGSKVTVCYLPEKPSVYAFRLDRPARPRK
jgi:hypothetical protein